MLNVSDEKLKYVFKLFDSLLCDGLAEKTCGKITTLDFCDRDDGGAPVFVDWQVHRYRRHGFYCIGELDGKQYGLSVDFGGTLTEEEYNEILKMFTKKYPPQSKKEINPVKIKAIFENADKVLCDGLRAKTNGVLDVGGCERDRGGNPLFVDGALHRGRRHGFYCYGEVHEVDYGMSYDDVGVLTGEEYEEVLKLFREKYPVASL